MKHICLTLLTMATIFSCKKAKFENDECLVDCYKLSGYVLENGTNHPVDQAEIFITAKKKKNTKYIVSTKTDQFGYWKMSFDADFIENLKEGFLEVDRQNYFYKKQRVYFNTDSIGYTQNYEMSLHKTAEIYFKLHMTNQNIKRVESRFVFEEQGYKALKFTKKEVPTTLSFSQTIPANQNINMSIWTSLEENSSGDNEWLKVLG